MASLLAAASPVYTLLNGFTFLSIRIWAYTFTALYVLFFFWYMSAYRYSDFLFEASEFGISSAEKAAVPQNSRRSLPNRQHSDLR